MTTRQLPGVVKGFALLRRDCFGSILTCLPLWRNDGYAAILCTVHRHCCDGFRVERAGAKPGLVLRSPYADRPPVITFSYYFGTYIYNFVSYLFITTLFRQRTVITTAPILFGRVKGGPPPTRLLYTVYWSCIYAAVLLVFVGLFILFPRPLWFERRTTAGDASVTDYR